MTLQVVQLDPLDSAQNAVFLDWHRVLDDVAAEVYGEWRTIYSPNEVRARHRYEPTVQLRELAAVENGAVVGTLEAELPLADNRHRVELYVTVRRDRRRRGIGSWLLMAAYELAAVAGRTVLGAYSEATTDGDPSEARGFATHHGFEVVQTELRSDLVLPVPEGRRSALEAEVCRHATEYEVLTSVDNIRDEWLAGRAELARWMSVDVPLGGLDYQEERWDEARVRRSHELARAQGRRTFESIARHRATGELVGYTTLHVPAHTPRQAIQWDTLVRDDHRGHRLGLALKIANLRALRAQLPAVERVSTWNARENEPMLRVNRDLGFEVVGSDTEWQKRLS
jgi:GNAT superfamily N-acetyltransferase